MILFVVIQLFLVVESRSSKIASDCVDHEEQERKDKQSKDDIYSDLSTWVRREVPSAMSTSIGFY